MGEKKSEVLQGTLDLLALILYAIKPPSIEPCPYPASSAFF